MDDCSECKIKNGTGESAFPSYHNDKPFMCGVVEGFYGRPWSTEQRRELFYRMKKFGMNTYMYAPKDDAKHRAYWRDQYSVEEVEHLSLLINDAKTNDVTFVYAISPGLDITFSNSKDVTLLKRKLDQMTSLGCEAFALLFDDIDLEMSSADKEAFQSLGHAQVAITNEIYEHLGQPVFLFCPTEYCASRAVPEVAKSPYLQVIGNRLMRGIDVMWTGPRVISQTITAASIDAVAAVLCRPPVIWDNLHANDYDHRRLFLGPYAGRSPDLIPRLRGVLTNPNCEFEANFVALHSLATWSRSSRGLFNDAASEPRESDADIKLEIGDDTGSLTLYPGVSYSHRLALIAAVSDWLVEFERKALPPTPPSSYTASTVPPPDDTAVTDDRHSASPLEPMEVIPTDTATLSRLAGAKEVEVHGSAAAAEIVRMDGEDAVEELACSAVNGCRANGDRLSVEEVVLLCDLLYLPYEHGSCSAEMLAEFHWLKANASAVVGKQMETTVTLTAAAEWRERAAKFDNWVLRVSSMADRLFDIPNRAILYDLYPFVWEARGLLSVVNAFVKWLGLLGSNEELCLPSATAAETAPPTWTFKGGLMGEFERLLPLSQAQDLFPYKPLAMPQRNIVYTVRPFLPQDEAAVYEVCRQTCDDGADGSHVFTDKPDLIGDKLVGDILTLSPHFCFVLEDGEGICGYAIGVLDALEHYRKVDVAWTPALRAKYPPPTACDEQCNLTPEEEMILSLHSDAPAGSMPGYLHERYPSLVRVATLQQRCDMTAAKRVLACLLGALKACGSSGVHCEVNVGEEDTLEYYARLGLVSPPPSVSMPVATGGDEVVVRVRAL